MGIGQSKKLIATRNQMVGRRLIPARHRRYGTLQAYRRLRRRHLGVYSPVLGFGVGKTLVSVMRLGS